MTQLHEVYQKEDRISTMG